VKDGRGEARSSTATPAERHGKKKKKEKVGHPPP
jgi:hypothetical protein